MTRRRDRERAASGALPMPSAETPIAGRKNARRAEINRANRIRVRLFRTQENSLARGFILILSGCAAWIYPRLPRSKAGRFYYALPRRPISMIMKTVRRTRPIPLVG
jgi:hypothetical protein